MLRGRHTEAESLFRRALAILEKSVGPDHPAIAETLNHLATLFVKTGRWEEAAGLAARARAIRERLRGR